MHRVCGLRLGLKFGVQLAMAKIFILRLTIKEMGLPRNTRDHTAEVAAILRLWPTIQFRKVVCSGMHL